MRTLEQALVDADIANEGAIKVLDKAVVSFRYFTSFLRNSVEKLIHVLICVGSHCETH